MSLSDTTSAIEDIVKVVLESKGVACGKLDPYRSLYEGGYALDSMETAGLSALLNERFGTDPFLAREIPRNIAEIVAFYTHVGDCLP